jgi:thioredoxin-related protein
MRSSFLSFKATVFFLLAAVVAAVAVDSAPGRAARGPTQEAFVSGARLELLVFEAEACVYCEIFRRDVAPRYRFAPIAAQTPLRFIDVDRVDVDKMGLAARLDVLPTTVLMKDGREVERITGLTAAETYLRLVHYMIGKNE